MNDLPWSEEIALAIGWWQHADHLACCPVDKPLFALVDDIVGLAWAAEQEVAIAQLGIDHVVGFGPRMVWQPFP